MPPVASFSVRKYLPNVVGNSVIAGKSIMQRGDPLAALASCVAVVAGCGDDAGARDARARRAPVPTSAPCGEPIATTALRVIAYTRGRRDCARDGRRASRHRRRSRRTPSSSASRSSAAAAALVAIGKTAPLAFDELADGTAIPILMAPPDGFCPVGPMTRRRASHRWSRAPATACSSSVASDAGGEPLVDRRALRSGDRDVHAGRGAADLVDADQRPRRRGAHRAARRARRADRDGEPRVSRLRSRRRARSSASRALFDHRAFHGAIAARWRSRCSSSAAARTSSRGACSGPALRTSLSTTLARPRQTASAGRSSPISRGASARACSTSASSATACAVRARRRLRRRRAQVDRFALADDRRPTPIAGCTRRSRCSTAARVLTAFDPDGGAQTGARGVLVPDGGGLAPIAHRAAARRRAARRRSRTARVLAIGGDPSGDVARYVPTHEHVVDVRAGRHRVARRARRAGRDPPRRRQRARARRPRRRPRQAWIYRPSLVGPRVGLRVVALAGRQQRGRADAARSDAPSIARGSRFVLDGVEPTTIAARALVGGPRMRDRLGRRDRAASRPVASR